MATSPDEPAKSNPLTQLADVLGLSSLAHVLGIDQLFSSAIPPEQQKADQATDEAVKAQPPTPPIEPDQSKFLTRVLNGFGLSNMFGPAIPPELRKRDQKTTAAMILMGESHRKALHFFDTYRRALVEDANRMKAEAPEAAVTDDYLDKRVIESTARYYDELNRLVAEQNYGYKTAALEEEPQVVEGVVDVTPRYSKQANPQQLIIGLAITIVSFGLLFFLSRSLDLITDIYLVLFFMVPIGGGLYIAMKGRGDD